MKGKDFSCSAPKCRKVDDDQMVSCDRCKRWWHYACANFNPDEYDTVTPWFCADSSCKDNENADVSSAEQIEDNLQRSQSRRQSASTSQTGEGVSLDLLIEAAAVAQAAVMQKDEELLALKEEMVRLKASLAGPSGSTQHTTNAEDQRCSTPKAKDERLEMIKQIQANHHSLLGNLAQHNQSTPLAKNIKGVPNVADHAFQGADMASLLTILNRNNVQELPHFSGADKREWPYFEEVFKSTTLEGRYNGKENVSRLRAALKGEAYQLVSDRLKYSSDADGIMDCLRAVFGRHDVLVHDLTADLLDLPALSSKCDPKIRLWAVKLSGFVADLKSFGREEDLNNGYVLTCLVCKLGSGLYQDWTKIKSSNPRANFCDLAKFLTEKVVDLPPGLSKHMDAAEAKRSTRTSKVSGRVLTHKPVKPSKDNGCVRCSRSHLLSECPEFKDMSPENRRAYAKEKSICFCCLDPMKHDWRNCRQRTVCGSEGCSGHHHPLLHQTSTATGTNTAAAPFIPQSQFHSSHVGENWSVLFKIVPVRIHGNDGKFIDTHAFLDDGSSISMIEKDLFDDLDLVGKPEELVLQWTKGVSRHEQSTRTTLAISAVNGRKLHLLKDVYTVKDLELPSQSTDVAELKRRYSHLRGLPLTDLVSAKPKLLVGLDQARFLCGRGQRHGKDEDPCAIKTLLGWVVYGKSSPTLSVAALSDAAKPSMHFLFHDAMKSEDELHELVRHHFTTEDFGVMAPKCELVSREVSRAIEVMHRTLKRTDKGYEIGLLWSADDVKLPDSYPMALSRMYGLEKSLRKKPLLLEWMNQYMRSLIAKGYARVASEEELRKQWPRIWYAPTFIVENPNKFPPKPRVVADVAAKVKGVALNTYLLKGPDNLVPLHAGLFKFRERAIAVNAVVKEMFHRIGISEEDQQCQRILWRDGDSSKEPTVYIMQVMMFGPRCSPTCSQFVKNHHAEMFREEFPEAVDGLINRTYVDDYFNSHDSVEQAVAVTQNAIHICKTMNFELVGVQSNSQELLRLTTEGHLNPKLVGIDPNSCESIVSKVLGMYWCPTSDFFTYKIASLDVPENFMLSDAAATKREMLRTLMRVFDPLGLVSYYIIRGRIILQEVWRNGFDWDEPITRDLRIVWQEFLRNLKSIENLKIPRRYMSWNPDNSNTTLIIFVDASEKAFAAVAYLRFQEGNKVEVAQVMAKAKVAPVKKLSIPRLELQAAVLGVRLATTVSKSHTIQFNETVFFSDSSTVLSWINSTKFEFPSFVAVRVGEILDSSSPCQWFHVKSGDNVADDATKWSDMSVGDGSTRWFNGPDYLRNPKDSWPVTQGKFADAPVSTSILNSNVLLLHRREQSVSFAVYDELKARFRARWSSSVRVIALLLRRKDILFKRPGDRTLFVTPDEYCRAENWFFRKIQLEAFPAEMLSLQVNRRVSSSSKLLGFSPFIDHEGTMRMSSRGQKAFVSYAARNPAILPKSHPLVDLFIFHHHEKNFHMGSESVIAAIRERAWIINIRVAFERVRSRCFMCKRLKVKPAFPKMGDLPDARLAFHLRPFTHVGVDCFGPMLTKYGRGSVKRYGMLFTCLTFRAVQIELLNDLTLDQCTMAIRRFVINRVVPRYFYSDNGLNFVGARNQMLKDAKDMETHLAEYAAKHEGIVWKFIPAYSPWMGGAWERLIQSVKKSIEFVLKDTIPREDVLRNALMEAQGQINRRPLTHMPVDPDDPKPLTPNSMLFGDDDRDTTAPGVFSEIDLYSKLYSCRCQHLMSQLVKRWYTEYLPQITRRTKWYKDSKPVAVGDIVLVIDPSEVRSAWQLGRVTKTFPGSDGVVRTADVKLSNGSMKLKRSVGRLAVLDLESSH